MRITESSLQQELDLIIKDGSKPVHFTYSCEIAFGEEVVVPFKLLKQEVSRRYAATPESPVARYTDKVILTVQLTESVVNKLYSNRENILITVFKHTQGEGGNQTNETSVYTHRYRAVLLNGKSSILEGNQTFSDNDQVTDMAGFKEVYFELLDLAVEQLRLKSVGTVYRDMTMKDIIVGTLTYAAGTLSLDDEDMIKGVDMVEPNHNTMKEQTVVEQGTPLMKFTRVLQESCGVYSAGIGHYIQNKQWYVFPEYNLKRFETAPKTLTILNVPRGQLPAIERTYYSDSGKVTLISTGETNHLDDSEAQQLNMGNGVRFLNADKVLQGGFSKMENGIIKVDKNKNIHEFVIEQRGTSLNSAPFSDNKITSNILNEESKVARRMGSFIRFTWENANADLIIPGMPCRFVYMKGTELITVYGSVVGVDFVSIVISKAIDATRYVQMASVTIFVEKVA